jgi:hypothetical protein
MQDVKQDVMRVLGTLLAEEQARPVPRLSRDQWDATLREYGKANVACTLQHAPTESQNVEDQREYAAVLVAWLEFEGALPPPVPPPLTPRQHKRMKDKEKKAAHAAGPREHMST